MATKFGLKSPIAPLVRQIGRRCFGLLGDFRPIQCNHAKSCTADLCCHGNDNTTFALGAESNRLPACLFVCMFVTLFKSILLLCFSMESSHFLVISSPWQTLQNVILRILICCHGNEIWAIFAQISNCFFFFSFPMESSRFWAVNSPWPPLQNVVLRFLS